jgi:hypothetical protein
MTNLKCPYCGKSVETEVIPKKIKSVDLGEIQCHSCNSIFCVCYLHGYYPCPPPCPVPNCPSKMTKREVLIKDKV